MSTSGQPAPDRTPSWLQQALAAIAGVRAVVIGDLCLDAYWDLADSGERSLETGLPINRVVQQRLSLGGAGNVAANLAALGAQVEVVGLVGNDGFGWELRRLLEQAGIGSRGIIAGLAGWSTLVYAKPMQGRTELSRCDFGGGAVPAPILAERLAARLAEVLAGAGALVINQQIDGVFEHPAVAAAINAVVRTRPDLTVLVDARRGTGLYPGTVVKANAAEAARLVDGTVPVGRIDLADSCRHALALSTANARPALVTRGERGLIVAHVGLTEVIPGIDLACATDPVGAGDTTAAAFAIALAGACAPPDAGRFANLAAAVTVRKLGTTGTATPAELRQAAAAIDHLWEPELAEDPRRARFVPGTAIELVRAPRPPAPIRHAIFDHDGTLSTLRQGWERIMEPMMVRAVLGSRFADAPHAQLQRATAEVRALIDRTTGIQTLVQMQGLIGLVRSFGCVPEAEILDEHGYKAIYNRELLEMVRARRARLENGELESNDFQIKGARAILDRLHAAGVVLHLASGTDQADVADEAQAMGYAHLFAGIHGAVGDAAIEAKRIVMDRIIAATGGAPFAVFGDGPVELREGRRRGGICVGVASDELRRFGTDAHKRARLIRAGADLITGDFSRIDALMPFLGLA